MGIKSGKGLSGALGRMRDVNYQYVPLPYQEMMTGNLMRQASYDKSEATLDEISALYDENFIAKDSEILEGQENQLNAGIDEMIESAGGDLGKLTGKFTNLYRKTASDKTYRNAKAQQVNRTEFIKELKKAKLDPGMAQYYLNQADEVYPGADKGQYSGVNYSNLTEAKVSKMLAEVGKNTPSMSEQSNEYAYADLNGNPITPEQAQQLGEGKYKKVQATRTVGYKDANKVYKNLQNYIENNPTVLQFMSDKANSLGMDPAEYMGKYLVDTSNRLSGVSKNHLSKFSDLPNEGADGEEDVNTIPSTVSRSVNADHPLADTGYLDIPGGSVVDAKNRVNSDENLHPDMKEYLSSIYDGYAEGVYIDENDPSSAMAYHNGSMFDVEGRTRSGKEGLITSFINNNGALGDIVSANYVDGNLNTQAIEEAIRGAYRPGRNSSGPQEGQLSTFEGTKLKSLLTDLGNVQSSIEEDLQRKNSAFAAKVSALKNRDIELDMHPIPTTESNKTTNAITSLINSGTAEVYTKDGQLADLKDSGVRNFRVIAAAKNPIVTGLEDKSQKRVLTVQGQARDGKVKTFEIRIPEEDFQRALGTNTTISLFKGTEVENYTPGIISTKLQMLRTGGGGTIGLSTEDRHLERAINNRASSAVGSYFEAVPPGSIKTRLTYTPEGFVIEGTFEINGVPEEIPSKTIKTIRGADEFYASLEEIIYRALKVNPQ